LDVSTLALICDHLGCLLYGPNRFNREALLTALTDAIPKPDQAKSVIGAFFRRQAEIRRQEELLATDLRASDTKEHDLKAPSVSPAPQPLMQQANPFAVTGPAGYGASQPSFGGAAAFFRPAAPRTQPGQALAQARSSFNQGTTESVPTPECLLVCHFPDAIETKLNLDAVLEFELIMGALSSPSYAVTAVDEYRQLGESGLFVPTEASSRIVRKPINSPTDWFLVLCALLMWWSDHAPTFLRDRVAYGRAFAQLCTRFGFSAAYDYDRQNRAYCARTGAPWSTLKSDLWLSSCLAPTAAAPSLPAPDRKRRAEAPLEVVSQQSRPPKAPRPSRFHAGREICRKYNYNQCAAASCPNNRAHVCWACSGSHPITACPVAPKPSGKQLP
jgi:hypothetical protein